MKKFLLLIGMIAILLPSYAQTLSPSPTTITSGGTLTITGAGETSTGYFTWTSPDPTLITYAGGIQSNWVSFQPPTDQTFYNIATLTPTSFKMKIFNGSNQAYTVTIGVRTNIYNSTPGAPVQSNVIKYFTVTVNPTPTTFTNVAASKVFYKNDCPTGFASDPYTYTVAAGTYSSQISQADANGKATAAINANGQNAANSSLTCKQVYYNSEISANFTKNDCIGSSIPGDPVAYVVTASKFTSLISQADADAKAQADLSNSGQNYANTNSTCILVPFIDNHGGSGWRGQDYSIQLMNTSAGDIIEWTFPNNAATILNGQGTSFLSILLKKVGGTLPYTFTITAKVTSTNGVIKTYTTSFISKFCGLCPQ